MEPDYHCEKCDSGFDYLEQLLAHRRIAHSNPTTSSHAEGQSQMSQEMDSLDFVNTSDLLPLAVQDHDNHQSQLSHNHEALPMSVKEETKEDNVDDPSNLAEMLTPQVVLRDQYGDSLADKTKKPKAKDKVKSKAKDKVKPKAAYQTVNFPGLLPGENGMLPLPLPELPSDSVPLPIQLPDLSNLPGLPQFPLPRDQVNQSPVKEKQFKCEHCGKMFMRKTHVTTHIKMVHEQVRDYKCNFCDKAFSTRSNLTKHIHTMHEKARDFVCEICNRNFKDDMILKAHVMKVHRTSDELKCDTCGKTFAMIQSLGNHIRKMHLQTVRYKCDHCQKEFKDKTQLNCHIITVHEQRKDYACLYCGHEFALKYQLKRHVLTVHDRQMEVKCDVCDKIYTNPHCLRLHKERVHEGKKEKCPICSGEYASLRQHIKGSHPKVPKAFKCDVCDMRFNIKERLVRHVQKVHKSKKPALQPSKQSPSKNEKQPTEKNGH